MNPPLAEDEINKFLVDGNLTITKSINWKHKKDHSHMEFHVPVDHQYNGASFNLQLVGTKNIHLNRYSFVLLMDNSRIRALDPFETHINRGPKREKILAPHKHKWCDQYRDTIAYHPTDITDPKNIELTFIQFLNECNIRLVGKFNIPPQVQLEFPI